MNDKDEFFLGISAENTDVEKASGDQLIIRSDRVNLKVQTSQNPTHFGTITLVFIGTMSYTTKVILYEFKHGYKHRPCVQSVIIDNDGNGATTAPLKAAAFTLNFEADEESVRLYIEPNFPPFTMPISSYTLRYYVYVEEAK